MRPVIGVAGVARVGKDAVAKFLISTGAARYAYSFADPIRSMIHAGFGVDMRSPYWQSKKEEIIPAFGRSPRQMMQTLGTEWGRCLVNDQVWILLAQEKLLNLGPGMVVADVRYDNEAVWIRKMGGTVVHVYRERAEPVASHVSEAGVIVEATDRIIHNNGSLEELQHSVRELFG